MQTTTYTSDGGPEGLHMLVRALKSFGGQGIHISQGQVFELPDDVDWLQAGLVEIVEGQPMETATAEPESKAMLPAAKRRTRKASK